MPVFHIQHFGLITDDPDWLIEAEVAHRVIRVKGQNPSVELDQFCRELDGRDDAEVAVDRGRAEFAEHIGRVQRSDPQAGNQNCNAYHPPILLPKLNGRGLALGRTHCERHRTWPA